MNRLIAFVGVALSLVASAALTQGGDPPRAGPVVVLVPTSQREQGDRFKGNLDALRKQLEADKGITQFNVLTFDVTGRWLDAADWIANQPEARAAALTKLDGVLLEGAADLGTALHQLAQA